MILVHLWRIAFMYIYIVLYWKAAACCKRALFVCWTRKGSSCSRAQGLDHNVEVKTGWILTRPLSLVPCCTTLPKEKWLWNLLCSKNCRLKKLSQRSCWVYFCWAKIFVDPTVEVQLHRLVVLLLLQTAEVLTSTMAVVPHGVSFPLLVSRMRSGLLGGGSKAISLSSCWLMQNQIDSGTRLSNVGIQIHV